MKLHIVNANNAAIGISGRGGRRMGAPAPASGDLPFIFCIPYPMGPPGLKNASVCFSRFRLIIDLELE
ncbi:hypothetical protein ACU4GD_32165 [Cupriavidus basilensis]